GAETDPADHLGRRSGRGGVRLARAVLDLAEKSLVGRGLLHLGDGVLRHRRVESEGDDPAEDDSAYCAGERSGTEAHRVLPAIHVKGAVLRVPPGHPDAERLAPGRASIVWSGSHKLLPAGKLVWHTTPTTRREEPCVDGDQAHPTRHP